MGKIALVLAICLSPLVITGRASATVPPWLKFDEFSEISEKAQQQRVKNFVFQLRATPGSVAVIVAYGGAQSCPDEARLRAARVRQLLLKSGIDARSIRVVDAGYETMDHPFYQQVLILKEQKSQTRQCVDWFKSFLQTGADFERAKIPDTAVCGWFKSFLPTGADLKEQNPRHGRWDSPESRS